MKSHRTLTALGLGLTLAFAASAIGCQSETTAEDEPSVAEQALEEAPAADGADAADPGDRKMRHHARKGHHGPEKLLRAALAELELSDEQRAEIERSIEGLRAGFDPGDHAEGKKALADAVRAGSVDPAALAGAGDLEAKMKEGRAKIVEALEGLHATLTPEQRAQLVDSLQSRMKEHGGKMGKMGKHGKMGKMGKMGSPAKFMLHGLEVSDEQRAKIDAALAAKGLDQPPEGMHERFAAMKEHKAALLEAFAGDTFEADALIPEAGPELARGKERFLEGLAVIVPLLDETQRAELAERIERGPMHHGKRGMKKGKRGAKGERMGPRHRMPAPEADAL